MQRMKVKALSGGERNRLLLAKLFLQGANLLVLDEPTNDLDLITLNVLERLLLEFTGSVLLVTHDRYFLDKVATSILSFEGDGKAVRYPGNYETYKTLKEQSARRDSAARKEAAKAGSAPAPVAKEAPKSAPAAPAKKAVKLSFKEQRELEGMELEIEKAEARKAAAEQKMADPANYAGPKAAQMHVLQRELDEAQKAVEQLYARWQVLQEKAGG
jgi:ATP-binding cassette subfamily F protein uup